MGINHCLEKDLVNTDHSTIVDHSSEESKVTKIENRGKIKDISPWIFTTRNCNLSCSYCYEELCNKNITQKTLYDINSYFQKYIDSGDLEYVNYRISGGEPLINFDIWKQPVLEAINTNNGKIEVSLLTNLTLLNKDMEKFIIDNQIGCSISLDGMDYSKPYKNGESSALIVRKKIESFLNEGFTKFNVSSVIDKDSFSGLNDLAGFIGKNKLLWNIEMDHFFMGEVNSNIIISKMKDVIDILNKYDYDFYTLFRFNNINLNNPQGGCSAGKHLVTVDINGDIYPCQTVIDKKPLTNIYSEEHLIAVLMKQKSYNIGFNYLYDAECNNCSLKKYCGSGCKLHNRKENKKYTCPIIKEVIHHVITKII